MAAQGPAAQAVAILVLLDPLIRARYPDAAVRITDLQRLADAAAAQPSLHDALAELTLDPPVSASDLAGPPRLDEDYLTISTIHAAKGLEWPIVHLSHLVDGALPSDMALGDPGGLAEEHRLFYVAITRARDHLYLYAPRGCLPPPRPRRPARLRPADPLPASRGAGRLRQRRRRPAGAGAARRRPPHRHGRRGPRLAMGWLKYLKRSRPPPYSCAARLQQ